MSNTTPVRPRATKRYKALLAAGLSDTEAFQVLGLTPEPETEDPRIAQLVAGGFTRDQAEAILAGRDGSEPVETKAPVAPVLTAKERAEALVAERALTFTRGRVYVTPSTIEAQARVMKTGTPEVVAASGVGRVSAVLVYREESGDVALQNLTKPV